MLLQCFAVVFEHKFYCYSITKSWLGFEVSFYLQKVAQNRCVQNFDWFLGSAASRNWIDFPLLLFPVTLFFSCLWETNQIAGSRVCWNSIRFQEAVIYFWQTETQLALTRSKSTMSKMWNQFKVNNKDTRTTLFTLVWCLCC